MLLRRNGLLCDIYNNLMNRPVPYINKRIKLREEERIRQHHLDHLRQMRPQTTNFDEMGPTINNRKK